MTENRIKICTLWSLEKVKPNYTFDLDDRRIYNEKTGLPLREMKDSGGYRKVELQTVGKKTKPLYVRIHKIVALAMIHNGPYELIEHLDDDKENNDPGNLAFSTHRENAISMLRNGKGNFDPSQFEFTALDGTVYSGSLEEISSQIGIPRRTLSDLVNKGVRTDFPYFKYNIVRIVETRIGRYRLRAGLGPVDYRSPSYFGIPNSRGKFSHPGVYSRT